MSNAEHYTTSVRWGARSGNQVLYDRIDRGRERSQPEWRFGKISGMIETAENLATRYAITRDEADAYAARSHQRAAAAWTPACSTTRSCRCSEAHGVRVGSAMTVAPAAASSPVTAAESPTANATRICPATRRPTSTSSM